ncbi:unnamed protein product [Rotaria magnacalcarata]|uniref:Protein sleepless n=1 Tax=Rotaria magnacalcarata TaxID=392030 RepID=A0A816QXI3_9BILA|nr:unnamed protein product [Rotaria magnacalcarata]CAF2034365.1 unnamed protein product [Rotaria magnacalcarata]CAF2066808.1 unnamed protein product [Rotaria magnacalcarata]CAF3807046.1 unnamed protein product [Rotaria magnacalcarata]CAF3820770.1 unnamed protein product [Rotaria magnacalcarata]
MMKFGIFSYAILFVLIPLISTETSNLNCYVCNSNVDEGCDGDSVPDVYKVECSARTNPYCRKIIQTVDEQKSVVRTCGSKVGSKSCYKTPGKNNAQVCSCDFDFCNQATSLNRQERIMTMMSSIIILTITMLIIR